jgi:hypothetical protein
MLRLCASLKFDKLMYVFKMGGGAGRALQIQKNNDVYVLRVTLRLFAT